MSVDRYLELAETAGRVRRTLDDDPEIDAGDILVTVRDEKIVLTGFVRRYTDISVIRRRLDGIVSSGVVDEIVLAVGRAPRMELPEADLILPSPSAAEHVARARR